MEKAQKEYYLNEKIKAIHRELGARDDRSTRSDELKKKIEPPGCPKDARRPSEPKQLEVDAADVRRGDGVAQLHRLAGRGAWRKKNEQRAQGSEASPRDPQRRPLSGLDKIKERILEFLAVRALVTEEAGRRSICFPDLPASARPRRWPSIARAMVASSSACRSAACATKPEIRGHRRTYIGAFPAGSSR